jgi:hypothetical protein
MHLQLYRCVEEFGRLLGVEQLSVLDRMEFSQGEYTTILEVIGQRDGTEQLMMCNLLERDIDEAKAGIMQLLERWTPNQTLGITFRFFLLKGRPVVSCNLGSQLSTQAWYRLHLLQRKMLAACGIAHT